MGEANRRRLLQVDASRIDHAARNASAALRKLAEAASSHLGHDCYLHAALGQILMADQGIKCDLMVGFAAWRVGSGDGDVISHVPNEKGFLPEGVQGFGYHAWLRHGDYLVDLTTYQLPEKARALDEADGGHTDVQWSPDYVVTPLSKMHSYKHVAQAPGPGVFYYEASQLLAQKLASAYSVDPENVEIARVIMRSPNLLVLGPRQL